MRIVAALGGEALSQRGEAESAPDQRGKVEQAATALAELAAEHEAVVIHGDGPEIGHMLELALRNRLPERDVVSVLTQIVVTGKGSEPNAIAEVRSLRVLVDSGALVICAGGGGIPVALNGDGTLHGVEAAIDADLTAALLARRLDADALLMLTDVEAVYRDWDGADRQPIAGADPAELRGMRFAGSIGRKVEAACRFATTTGRRAAIGSLTDLAQVARGEAGTQVLAPAGEVAIAAARRPRR